MTKKTTFIGINGKKEETNVINFMDAYNQKNMIAPETVDRLAELYLDIMLSKVELILGVYPDTYHACQCMDIANEEISENDEVIEPPSVQIMGQDKLINRAIELYFGDNWK